MAAKVERKPKFNDRWLELPEFQNWLQQSHTRKDNSETGFCKLCQCNIVAHKSDLLKHRNSKKHKKNEVKLGILPNVYPSQGLPSQMEDTKKSEMLLYEFMSEHQLPSKVKERLVPLCKNIFPDNDIETHITAAKEPKSVPYATRLDQEKQRDLDILYMKLKVPGMFFSINMDKTTDESGIKQYSLTAVFMDGEEGVRYNFFDMFRLKDVPPKVIYLSIKNSIVSKGIPLENLVGFSSDTTSVMAEEHNAVLSHLKAGCPDIACIKCSCQSIHLAASNACLKLPPIVEDLLRNLGSHFSNVYGQHLSFTDFQQFFHVDIYKALSPGITRWLSVKECVERVLDKYDALQAYIHQTCNDGNYEATQIIINTMSNLFTKAYLQFMSYILGILDEFNVMFQGERPLLHKMKSEVEKLLKNICLNFLRTDYVRKTPAFELEYTNSTYYLPLDRVYLGVSAYETINDLKHMPNVEESDLSSFCESILHFYVELVKVLLEEFDFCDELYNIVSVVDPKIAQEFKTKSLVGVWKRFPALKKFTNIQALDNEWKKHALLDHRLEGLDPGMPADDYWRKVLHVKSAIGAQAFPNLFIVMKLLLALPFFPTQVVKETFEQ